MRLIAYKGKPFYIEIHIPQDVVQNNEVYADIYKIDGRLITQEPIKLSRVGDTDVYYAQITAPDVGKYDVAVWIGSYDAQSKKRNIVDIVKYIGLEVKEVDPDDLAKRVSEIEHQVKDLRKKLMIYAT